MRRRGRVGRWNVVHDAAIRQPVPGLLALQAQSPLAPGTTGRPATWSYFALRVTGWKARRRYKTAVILDKYDLEGPPYEERRPGHENGWPTSSTPLNARCIPSSARCSGYHPDRCRATGRPERGFRG